MNKLILPLPPSLNHAYITRRGSGQRIQTDTCREYKGSIYCFVKKQIKEPYKKLSLIQYRFFLPDNRRRDLPDNYSKVLRDALKGCLFVDDCWQMIKEEIFIGVGIDKNNPRVEITFTV